MHRVVEVECSSAQSRKHSKILDNSTYDREECEATLQAYKLCILHGVIQTLKVVTHGPTPLLPTTGLVTISFSVLLF
jgi:hypothetical protein